MRASELLGPLGPFAQKLARYEDRPAQREMADAVEHALQKESVVLVEAGTGTGKTLAYLLPALLSGKKVVVATGTKTLQDQIMNHDVPLLERVLDEPVEVACLKGLSNYLCLRRFEEFRASAQAVAAPYSKSLRVLEPWRERTATGDRAELDALTEDDSLWPHVVSGSDTRVGPRCEHYESCFVTAARRAAEQARVVVVNHHLFFADLAMRTDGRAAGAGALPDYDAVIFDEAHQIEDVATEFFGVRVSTARIESLLRDTDRALSGLSLLDDDGRRRIMFTGECSATFFAALAREARRELGRQPLRREVFQGALLQTMYTLDSALESVALYCKARVAKAESVAQLARRAQQVRDDLVSIAEGGKAGEITWTETRGRNVSIGASPIDISEIFRERVLYRASGVVLTSATLSTGGSFSFAKQRLGIDFECEEKVLPSPFAFETQAALYLPETIPEPRSPEYVEAAAREVLSLVTLTQGGAFVLCTSNRMMQELAARCAPKLAMPVLVQGDAPKTELLTRFREAEHAVLFATSSFWEGVDVPGHALRLVIIDKLPFDVPTDPLVVARCEKLKQSGSEPFMRYLVPVAAIALKQGFGRLVRTKSDRGIVAILDRRLTTKGYGKVFLRSLPPARRCTTIEQVRAFYEDAPSQPLLDGSATTAVP